MKPIFELHGNIFYDEHDLSDYCRRRSISDNGTKYLFVPEWLYKVIVNAVNEKAFENANHKIRC